mmetsp:Transcript_35929/g.96541  ORF Transcript_35929/g.96541 Transcript_35929/m.96541 type:complete len:229 (+) Transcript_35929:857-1543(+)
MSAGQPLRQVRSPIPHPSRLLEPLAGEAPRKLAVWLALEQLAIDQEVPPVVHADRVLRGGQVQAHEGVGVEEVDQDGVELGQHVLNPHLHGGRLHPLQAHVLPVLLEPGVHLCPVPRGRRGRAAVDLGVGHGGDGHIPGELLIVSLLVRGHSLGAGLADLLDASVHDKLVRAAAWRPLSHRHPVVLIVGELYRLDGELERPAELLLRVHALPLGGHFELAADVLRDVL